MKRLVLIDGHAILHRAYHAFPKTLKTRQGELVNAVYGFTRMLLSVLEDLKPTFVVVAFDLPKPTFRHQEYLGYQIQRPAMDEELAGQIKRVYQIVESLNIPIFAVEGYEADDVIGSLASQARQKSEIRNPKSEIIIVTGDKDMMQLVGKKVKVYAPRKSFSEPEIFDIKKVREFLGIKPEQIVDYKALTGDASDNYPGVPGIGPKTAIQLLQKYGSLDNIYKNIKKIKPLVAEKLIEGKESAALAKKLATIVTNVPIKLNLKSCQVHDYEREKAKKLFEELEFRSLIEKLPGMEKNKKGTKKDQQIELFNDK
jgi:DNA polymerase-1